MLEIRLFIASGVTAVPSRPKSITFTVTLAAFASQPRWRHKPWKGLFLFDWGVNASSETQGQIVGARESLNGRENMAGRKVKDGEKSPWGQCLTRPVPNGHSRSGYWLVPENFCVFLSNQKPEWRSGSPWVSEDGVDAKMITVLKKSLQINPFGHPNSISCTVQ